jgi:peptidoglycan-associated lipoprotein
MVEGPVQVTVRVSDGKGGTASDVVTIQVIREAVKEVVFEDVHFDFDRYSLRPEALRRARRSGAVAAGESDAANHGRRPHLQHRDGRVQPGAGERRANAVREYLASRGIAGDRLQTVSYGEERPKYDNARAKKTRRLNRRAAMVVRVQ